MRLTVVGLGPGDPELVTVKGVRAIEAADVVFVPRSRDDEESRALRIAQRWIDTARQQVIPLTLPMARRSTGMNPREAAGADPREPNAFYRSTAERIGESMKAIAAQRAPDDVNASYLLLGDPLLYGTFTSIRAELAVQYPQIGVEILPGVTSFAAAAARAGVPLSVKDERVAIVPATYETDIHTLGRLCADFETVILMKVGSVLPQVIAALDALGLLDGAVYAEYVGMPEERIVDDVRSLRDHTGPYLSLMIVRRRGEEMGR